MATNLRQLFPIIRTREEICREIQGKETLRLKFQSWPEKAQQEFLDFCSGARGVKILYDSFFKEIFNPEAVPERLEQFLSLIMRQKVKIYQVLPGDSTRIAAESSLLIMDIIVELEDGSLVNLEVQKIGYAFPGQRSACYSADLLLRQYRRLRGEKAEGFSYRDIKRVYTIVLFETSPRAFYEFREHYRHHFWQQSDTGLKIDLLQHYFYLPLDIFRQRTQNEIIKDETEAWLTFLTADEPEKIAELLKFYPKFHVMYEELYEICRNTERVMEMFSKELLELDRNTVQYMIDEMQETIEQQRRKMQETEQQNRELQQQYEEALKQIEELKKNKS